MVVVGRIIRINRLKGPTWRGIILKRNFLLHTVGGYSLTDFHRGQAVLLAKVPFRRKIASINRCSVYFRFKTKVKNVVSHLRTISGYWLSSSIRCSGFQSNEVLRR